jgi:6-phosphogluconolactonase
VLLEVLANDEAVAIRGARLIATAAREAVAERGRFVVALSGGRTPWRMLRLLAHEDVPWIALYVVQVDERIAPPNDPDRNLTHLEATLIRSSRLPTDRLYGMPVNATDLTDATTRYAKTLERLCGIPPVLDLVQLGLGADGHTASLVPGDPLLDVSDRDVGLTLTYRGRRRMTLTFPIIDRARRILWVVTGNDKRAALADLRAGNRLVPAGRVRTDNATILADRLAAPSR